ncbi:MAG: MFS transporter [Clostridia bacterium]|nr:MFS transporter [Clostridia bacterium]
MQIQWRRNLWIISLGAFIANISFTFVLPFMPDLLVELGVKENLSFWAGVMIAVNFFTKAVMAPVWGSLADRYGKKLMLARSGFGMVITFFLMGICTSPLQLFIIRALNGICSGFITAGMMLIVSNTPEGDMPFAVGILNTFTAVGGITGPIMAGILLQFLNIKMVIFVAAGLLFLATVLALWGTKEKIIPLKKRTTIFQDMKVVLKDETLRVYIFCLVMLNLGTQLITPTLPLRVAELTTSKPELFTGILFSITGVSLAIGSPFVCRIRRFSYPVILLLGLMLSGIFNVTMGLTASLLLLGIERFLLGFTNSLINVSGNVLVTSNSNPEMRGRVFGILHCFVAIGMGMGPLIGGFIGEQINYGSAFYGSAFFFFLAAVAVYQKMKIPKRPKPRRIAIG